MNAEKDAPCRFVVLISGRGSNMQAIVQATRSQGAGAVVSAVIANKADASGLAWADRQGIPTAVVAHRDFASREAFDASLADAIDAYQPHYVLLAGFMRVLTPGFVERFNGRLVNIHPSLLPAFPGLHTHQQALAMGVQWHGCTVHFVTPVLDHGPVIAQGIVPVLASDTPDDLAHRLLKVEHVVYTEVVHWLAQGRVTLDALQRVHVKGVPSRSFMLAPLNEHSPKVIA
ncbi:MAG: phosphoribosylglycinamide formyltransferase [Burkholderiaceae bacterium]